MIYLGQNPAGVSNYCMPGDYDEMVQDVSELKSALEPAASSSDIGKFLKAKTVANGKVTEYELGADAVTDVQVNGTSVVSGGVASVPMAGESVFGVVKVGTSHGVKLDASNTLNINAATAAVVKSGGSNTFPLTPARQHEVVFYGLAKAAGDSTQSASSNAVGTYTADAKAAIQTMLGVPGDVQINSTSIVSNGVANIPVASTTDYGAIKIGNSTSTGLTLDPSGYLKTSIAYASEIKAGTNGYKPIVPTNQHVAVFYGLATAAGDSTQSASDNAVGTYTDSAKAAIQHMLGTDALLAPVEADLIADQAYAVGDVFLYGGKLHKVTAAISQGGAIDVGTNCEETSVSAVYIKNTDTGNGIKYNASGKLEIKTDSFNPFYFVDGATRLSSPSDAVIKNPDAVNSYGYNLKAISPTIQHKSVFYGLAKAAGDTTQASSDNAVGTYTDNAKSSIRTMIGAVGTTDYANASTAGVVKVQSGYYGIDIWGGNSAGILAVDIATNEEIKSNSTTYPVITTGNLPAATFYGLAKASGDTTQAQSSNAVGTYTDSAKAAIQSMLGVDTLIAPVEQDATADKAYFVGQSFMYNGKLYKATSVIAKNAAITPGTNCEETNARDFFVRDVRVDSTSIVNDGVANLYTASIDAYFKLGTNTDRIITPSKQHIATFYGLAKAAGDATQSASDNAVGTYTDDAKAAIQTMLGVPGDVQVNGTSVVSNGIATIPLATNGSPGLVTPTSTYGVKIVDGNYIGLTAATDAQVKGGTAVYATILPNKQHMATFYGLAKAAGDSTQSASSNAVGTYTDAAKTAIHTMLGIDPSAIAAQVEIPLVETVTGTTPSITGQPNTRYVCGEISTLSITPPSSGSIDVIFESGSTATVLTVPNTVKWPAWFDATTLEADTTYEILITDGVYGSVMTWAT